VLSNFAFNCNLRRYNEGLHTTTSRTGHTPPTELAYKCSARDIHVFKTIGTGASSVVKKAVHVPSHRFLALKMMTVFEKEKRQQMINEMRTLAVSYTRSLQSST
jgi:hypothetical protein